MYEKSFEVRWDDVDLNGHLRSTRYLEYTSTARVSFLRSAGWDVRTLEEAGYTVILLGEEVRYLREVFFGEVVSVQCEVVGLTEDLARWSIRHRVLRENGEEAATVRSLGAWLDLSTRRIAPPPEEVGALLRNARSDDFEIIDSRSAAA